MLMFRVVFPLRIILSWVDQTAQSRALPILIQPGVHRKDSQELGKWTYITH